MRQQQIRTLSTTLLCAAAISAAVGVAAIPAAASTAPGAIGVRLLPATRSDPSNGQLSVYIIADLPAGATLTRRVEVSNSTRSTQRVSVYPAGARLASGAFVFAAGRSANQLSSWITVSVPTVVLAPRAVTTFMVTIRAPRGATHGERYAVVWAQVSERSSSPSTVRLVNRVGIRIYLTVGSTRHDLVLFRVRTLTAHASSAGAPFVEASVLNLGGSSVRIAGTVTLADGPGGIGVGARPVVPLSSLTPGDVGRVSVQFRRGLPRGPWRAVLWLSNGSTSQRRATELMFPAPATSSGTPWSRARDAALALIVLSAVVLLVRLLRRARTMRSAADRVRATWVRS